MSELYDVLKLVADHSQLAKDDPEFFLPEEIADRVCHVLLTPPPGDGRLREALDAAQTVLSDIYKREGKGNSFHASRVKADIESIMPLVERALGAGKEGEG